MVISRRGLLSRVIPGAAAAGMTAVYGSDRFRAKADGDTQGPSRLPYRLPGVPFLAKDGQQALVPKPLPTGEHEPTTLRGWAEKIDFGMGVFFGNKDPRMVPLTLAEFNLAALWIGWSYSEAVQGIFDTTSISYFLKVAVNSNVTPRGHMLVWANDVPAWVSNGHLSRDALAHVMQSHIRGIITPYKGMVKEWIVVNEGYNPPYVTDDIFYSTIGSDYIDMAFQTAREADPGAFLIYNNAENHFAAGVATKRTQDIIKKLKASNLVDAVGLEMHLDAPQIPNKLDIINTMRIYDLPVCVTELDVNLRNIGGSQAERFALQAQIYQTVIEAAIESGVCKSVLVWGINDANSVYETMPSLNWYSPVANPLLFDNDFRPKPAYYATLGVLKAVAH